MADPTNTAAGLRQGPDENAASSFDGSSAPARAASRPISSDELGGIHRIDAVGWMPRRSPILAKVERVLIWSGIGMIALWVGAFIFLAGFIPPSSPDSSADAIVSLYANHTTSIKLGMVISMLGSALLVPYAVAISGQLKRIDGAKPLADIQMVSCALLSLEFITPIGVWMAASFRFDGRSAELTRTVHDLGWILFMTVIWSLWVQLIAIGVAILLDRRPDPVLPRWLAYLNLWVALLIMPAGMVLFFKTGPFAWNGVIGFFVPLTGFAIWIVAMTLTIHRRLTHEIRLAAEDHADRRNGHPPDH